MVAILKTLQADGHDQSPDAFLFPALFTSREHDPSQVSRFIRETLTPYIQESTKLTDIKFTAHGFARSTLKDWWTAKGYPEALWKLQVGQRPEGKVNQSYGHDRLIETRRPYMEEWDAVCSRLSPDPAAGAVKLSDYRKKRRSA